MSELLDSARTSKLEILRKIEPSDIEALVDEITKQLSRDELANLLEKHLKLPRDIFYRHPSSKQALIDTADVVAERKVVKSSTSVLVMTDDCAQDGRILGATSVLPAGTRRVYGVFEPSKLSEELDHVLAIWRRENDYTLQFM